MSSVYFVGDLHLGHRTILDHTAEVSGAWRGGTTPDEHDAWVIDRLLSVRPNKRTLWWILGDVAMEESRLDLLKQVPGRKRLVLGNHDLFKTLEYLRVFEWIAGVVKDYDFWISHAPIHPEELWGLPNVHGHTHRNPLRGDVRYLNVCIEWLPQNQPLSLEQVRAHFRDL